MERKIKYEFQELHLVLSNSRVRFQFGLRLNGRYETRAEHAHEYIYLSNLDISLGVGTTWANAEQRNRVSSTGRRNRV